MSDLVSDELTRKLEARGIRPEGALTAEAMGRAMPGRLVKFQESHRVHRLTVQAVEDRWHGLYQCADCGGVMFPPVEADTLADSKLRLRLDDLHLTPHA